ncbi:nitroreductase family protein [Desulforhabdus sp. TSK]|uniref:nitroreductase family protein n=1 Tax=Desulforhabdus sp. TSK TaxID=2925014 RepID=UPI001FC7D5FF|nr:nitroreductase family protein [Desulforhabdus sp. TSK]GKT10889.1 hypothetical protein DSTSK_41940 [Desulforhabdus sp. TSK]
MKKHPMILPGCVSLLVLILSLSSYAADFIQLPAPQTTGGKPLMEALKDRKTTRTFSDEKLSMQTLSNLLWAAFGINRPDGRRTAPSAKNWQEIDIYVAAPEGAYLWDAGKNGLSPVSNRDLRAMTGPQAAVGLVYVADYSRVVDARGFDKDLLVAADTGFISQNVYLFCASESLATVVRGGFDRSLIKELKLKREQKIILVQPVGYPKNRQD